MNNHARWSIVTVAPDALTIRDTGHAHGCRTVTNDAELIAAALAPMLTGRRLYYYDSENNLDEIVISDGKFAGFAPGPERTR